MRADAGRRASGTAVALASREAARLTDLPADDGLAGAETTVDGVVSATADGNRAGVPMRLGFGMVTFGRCVTPALLKCFSS